MHARIQEVLSEGSNFHIFFLFLVDKGREDPNTTISGPTSDGSETPFKWRFAGVPMMVHYWMLAWQLCDFQGMQTSIAMKPYIFVIFKGGGVQLPAPPPLDPHMM